MFSLVNKVYQ